MHSVSSEQHTYTRHEIAKVLDHTKLTFKPGEDQEAAMRQLFEETRQQGFKAACVRPEHVAMGKSMLAGTDSLVATVIGFPKETTTLAAQHQRITIGDVPTEEKLAEIAQCLRDGVDELDIVLYVAQFKADRLNGTELAFEEVLRLKEAANGVPIKLIVETDLLNAEEILAATDLCHRAELFMIKHNTGMIEDGTGATPEQTHIMHQRILELNSPLQIKASAKQRTLEDVLAQLKAGASRIGTSSGVSILQHVP